MKGAVVVLVAVVVVVLEVLEVVEVVVVVVVVMMIVPQGVLVGRASVPRVLVMVGFQLLIHLLGSSAKARVPLMMMMMMMMVVVVVVVTLVPILRTLAGIVTVVRLTHFSKA